MKKTPAHPYYDIQELLKAHWNEYPITEKDLIKWGAKDKLQFSVRLTPPAKHFFLRIECGYTEYIEDSSFWVPLEQKDISYGDYSEPYRLHPSTLDKLSNHALKGNVIPVILTNCEWCEEKCALSEDRDSNGTYTSYEVFPCNYARSSSEVPSQDNYGPTITKDDLLVCRSEVIRFGKILERDYSAQAVPAGNNESADNSLSTSTTSPPDTILQNSTTSLNPEKWQKQVERIEFPDGTNINKIEIRFEAIDKVIVTAECLPEPLNRGFESLGFRKNQITKEKEWNSAWLLLHDIARNKGIFAQKNIYEREGRVDGSQSSQVVQKFKDTLSKINKRLKHTMPVFGDNPPIKYNKKKNRWESCFTLELTSSYAEEFTDQTPNTDYDPDLLRAIGNDQGHIHDKSTDNSKDHLSEN